MQLFNQEKPENTDLEIYSRYYQLDTEHLIELMSKLDRMYKRLLDYSYPVYFSEKYEMPFRNFLEIESFNTGESVKIKFKEGWKPEFRIKKKDLEIRIPLKLGIPLIILYLILQSAQKITSLYNETLEMQIKELDIKVKQLELQEKISEKDFQRRPFYYRNDLRQADDFVNYLINNPYNTTRI